MNRVDTIEGGTRNGRDGAVAARRWRASFVTLPTGAPAALYEPLEAGDRTRIAFVIMHPDGNFISHMGCGELAGRGFRALGVNSRFANLSGPTGGPYPFREVIPDVGAAVAWLRSLHGVRHVILIGHSGGGPLMAAYQNLAENGTDTFRSSDLLDGTRPDAAAGPPADGIVLLDSHVGYASHALLGLDPAIVDELSPRRRDPALDMFSTANGYGTEGATYSPDFVKAFTAAQAARMERLVAYATRRLTAIDAGHGDLEGDEPIVIPGVRARLWIPDTGLLARTRGRWGLLCRDGLRPPSVVSSLRPSRLTHDGQDAYRSALVTTVRSFLATHAVRTAGGYCLTADTLGGIDWASSFTSAPANLAGVSIPLLSLVMSGHYFLVMNEVNFAHAASADKEMVMVEGAQHSLHPYREAERYPGEFGDTVASCFDYIEGWIGPRF